MIRALVKLSWLSVCVFQVVHVWQSTVILNITGQKWWKSAAWSPSLSWSITWTLAPTTLCPPAGLMFTRYIFTDGLSCSLTCRCDVLSLPVRLRQIPPALLQFPLQALKVRVSGLKAPSSNTHETVLPYSPKWSVRAMLDMIRLLENNVTTALVVVRYTKKFEVSFWPAT